MRHKIIMSPKTNKKDYSSFFGLYGALPMAFTEMLLYDFEFDNIDDFFDEAFASIILKNAEFIEQESKFARCFIKEKKHLSNFSNKFISIKNNQIGIDKLNWIILGSHAVREESSSMRTCTLGSTII